MAKDLRPVGLDFFESAPHRYVTTAQIGHPVDAVFAALADDPAGWAKWFPGFSDKSKWLTPAPHGVGSQREMVMRGQSITETIIAWDASTRWSYFIARATMPGIRVFAEDYALKPVDGGTELTWTVALDALGPVAGLLGKMGGKQFKTAAANLDKLL
jgi:Polyketide cyclase / dehydrase and lipid transport